MAKKSKSGKSGSAKMPMQQSKMPDQDSMQKAMKGKIGKKKGK